MSTQAVTILLVLVSAASHLAGFNVGVQDGLREAGASCTKDGHFIYAKNVYKCSKLQYKTPQEVQAERRQQ